MKYAFLVFLGLVIWPLIKADITQAHSNNLSSDLYQLDSNLMNDKQWMDAPEYSLSGGMGFVGVLSYSDEYSAYGAYLSVCGNGAIEENEVCDTNNFNNKTCDDYGYPEGILYCANNCQEISTVNCTAPIIYGGSGGSYGRNYVFRGVSSQRASYLEEKEIATQKKQLSLKIKKQILPSHTSAPIIPQKTLKESPGSESIPKNAPTSTKLPKNVFMEKKIVVVKDKQEQEEAPQYLPTSALKETVKLNNVIKEEITDMVTSLLITQQAKKNRKEFVEPEKLETKLLGQNTSLKPLSYRGYISLVAGGFNKLLALDIWSSEDEDRGFLNYVVQKSMDFVSKLYPSFLFRLGHV